MAVVTLVRILIADDDPLIVRLLEANLKRWGYEVVIARDGLEALAALEGDASIHLLITDWMMPGIDGVELTRRIRELTARPYTYVMLLTAKDQTEDLIHAFQAGVDEFVNKPFRARELQMRLEAAKRLLDQMSQEGLASRPAQAPDQGMLVGGRYRLTQLLGAGGMGTVWEAEHITLGCTVAVKFLRAEHAKNEAAGHRFTTEARAAAKLSSPHAVRVFDFGTSEDGSPYLVMEHLKGTSLADLIGSRGPMRPSEVAKVIAEVASALVRAHALGIIHRDVKPENILLAEDEVVRGYVTTKLIDFGVAKVDGGEEPSEPNLKAVTQEGVVVGTPHFMSPEYLAGGTKPNAALDIWGLAVCAYAGLVGALPFDGDTVWGVIRSVCAAPLPIPSEQFKAVPAGFDAWFAKACAREPKARFQTPMELAESLAEVCGVVPPLSAPKLYADRGDLEQRRIDRSEALESAETGTIETGPREVADPATEPAPAGYEGQTAQARRSSVAAAPEFATGDLSVRGPAPLPRAIAKVPAKADAKVRAAVGVLAVVFVVLLVARMVLAG